MDVINDAQAMRDVSAAMILLETVTPEVGDFIARDLGISVYSIGSGPHCGGQLLTVSDVPGIREAFKPKFVRRYAEFADLTVKVLARYAHDVKTGRFPEGSHCYKMIEGEAEKPAQSMQVAKWRT